MMKSMKNGLGQLKKSWYIFFFQIPRLPEWLLGRNQAKGISQAFRNSAVNKDMFPDEVVEVYRKNANQPGALTAMINYYRGLFKGRKNSSIEDIAIIDTPTLMVWGEDDVALSKDTTYGTQDYVTDFRIRYLPRVSHWVQQEAPEAVNASHKFT